MSDNEERPYQEPEGDPREALRREKVILPTGYVWVWGLDTAEMLAVKERAMRPSIDPRGGVNESAATAWLVAMCTRREGTVGSPRVWDDLSYDKVLRLPAEVSGKLVQACRRVNGMSEEEVEATEDFSKATRAPKPSDSTSSVSSNSAGSPPNSAASLITR